MSTKKPVSVVTLNYCMDLHRKLFKKAFYFPPLTRTLLLRPWFTKQVVGHNTLSKMMAIITSEAGVKIRSNYALRAISDTRMFQAGVPKYDSGKDRMWCIPRTGSGHALGVKRPRVFLLLIQSLSLFHPTHTPQFSNEDGIQSDHMAKIGRITDLA